MNLVYDQAFGAKTPTYSTVLQLDRKLRGFTVPPSLQIAGFGNSESRVGSYYESVPLILQRHLVLAIRESSTYPVARYGRTQLIGSYLDLLYMHRGFFARAISDHPKDPLGSPYGGSFIAAYRSAGSLVALVRNIHSQLKELTERMWFLWTHLFSCSVSIIPLPPSVGSLSAFGAYADYPGIHCNTVSVNEPSAVCSGPIGFSLRPIFQNCQVLPRREGAGECSDACRRLS